MICSWGLLSAQPDPEYQGQVNRFFSSANQYLYTNKDSANKYFEKLYKLSADQLDWETGITALQYINFSSGYHYDLTTYRRNLDKSDSLFQRLDNYLDSIPYGHNYRISHLIDKGNYYYKINDNQTSRGIFQQVIEAIERVPDSLLNDRNKVDLGNAYSFIASTYSNEDQYELAKEYYQQNLRVLKKSNLQADEDDINNTYNLLADVHTQEHEYDLANRYLRRSLDYYLNRTEERYKNNIVTTLFLLSQNYINLTQLDSAAYYLNLSKKYLLERDPFLPIFYQIQGTLKQNKDDLKGALEAFNQQLELTRRKWDGKHSEVAQVYNKLGALYESFNQFDHALSAYQKALQQLSVDFNSIDITFNPLLSSVIDNTSFFRTLKNKAGVLNQLKDTTSYHAALETVTIGITVLDSLKPTFESGADKLSFLEDAFPMFEAGIEAAYQLYKVTSSPDYIDQAFHFSEKSKGALLLEALRSTRAYTFAGIPSELLEKEKQLKSLLIHLKKQVKEGQEDLITSEELFQTNTQYRELIEDFENNYKEYYNLKYNTQVIGLKAFQNSLAPEEVVISYFFGDQAIYCITITSNSRQMHQIPITHSLAELMVSARKGLNNSKSNVNELASITQVFYKTLVAPALENKDFARLVIIPDGFLHYIPFGGLNTQPGNRNKYLIELASISYANSATLQAQLQAIKNNRNGLLAVAPNFDTPIGSQDSLIRLLPLVHNKQEATGILSHFEGKLLVDTDASLQSFLAQNENYGILHLATHAVINDQYPEYSYLAFTPKKDEEHLLFVSDLYNLDLKANLVTLSACESGIGDLKRGEGFISLSRAFFYGGAKSIANSKWNVNDLAASQIMKVFYQHLADGKSKDTALRLAKLNFLDNHRQNNLQHPYYWSGIVISGTTDPVTSRPLPWKWLLLFGLILVGMLAAYIKKGRGN